MLYLVDHHGFKPKYHFPCYPENPVSVLPHHAYLLYGIKMANMLVCGNISICDMYSTTEYFDAVGPVKKSMPQVALKDLVCYMYFSDDWDNDRGGELFL